LKEEIFVKNIIRLGLLIAVFMVSAAASAATFTPYYADVPGENCGPVSGDRPCYIATGVYIQCTAKGEQTCQATQYSGSVAIGCASVKLSANCQCDSKTHKATGYCAYYR
jgi:hypothetical protein